MKSKQLNHHTRQITAKQEWTTPNERMNEKVYAESNATVVNCLVPKLITENCV